jgi:arginine-tRNA-protein transferase
VVTELAGPDADLLYEALTEAGFRRSQSLVYKPACEDCNACVAVRVRADRFRPGRSLRRVRSRNGDLVASEAPPLATPEHYDLFRRYLEHRHGDGGMVQMDFADYRAMIEDTPVDTVIVEYRRPHGELLAVCLSDRLGDGYSLVYSFFEPDADGRSLGTYIILWHLDQARQDDLPYVYLGYWIPECAKMAYKNRFKPLEALFPEGWKPISHAPGASD